MTNYTRRNFLKTLGVFSAATLGGFGQGCASLTGGRKNQRRPNIVFFLVDDMGWMDTTVYGSKYYETPSMERLAKRSMMFTDAYTASPLCSPTRSSIMSGKYPARTGLTSAAGHLAPRSDDASRYPEKTAAKNKMILPRTRRFLHTEEYTIAEALRDGGYRTAHIGKWHLGLEPRHWPEEQGFEVSFHAAPDPGPRKYFSPYLWDKGTVTDGPEGEYITDRITDEALKFVEEHRDEPFLLHLWQYGVHGPWEAKEEYTKYFAKKKDPRGKQGNPIMASMLKSVDESLGRLMDKLDELKLTENTIIIFFSDNGGNIHSNLPTDSKAIKAMKMDKSTLQRQRIEAWRHYAGDLPPTNNYPLRKGKAWIYEGGTRVPLMISWPGTVEPGSKCSEVVSSVDFYPTMLKMSGVSPNKEQLVDGESIVPLLKQTGTLKRDAIFCYFPHGGPTRPAGVYVRRGDWKLIRWYLTGPDNPEEFELYNLKDDISETKNLAKEMPERVKELNALIDAHLKETGAAVPIPNPAYDPGKR
ncbi:sulfatase [Candidatus Hydrogenedentota bacterium]